MSHSEPHVRPTRKRRRAVVAVLLLAGVLSPIVWRIVDDRRFQSELTRAQTEIAAHQYAPAQTRLAELVARRPKHVEALYQLGVCEDALGHPEAANTAWTAVPESSTRGPEASVARSRLLIHTFGRLGEAEAVLQAALRGPRATATSAFWILVELFIWQGRTDEARLLLEEGWRRHLAGDRITLLREHWRLDRVDVTEDELKPILTAASTHAPGDPRVALLRAAIATRYGRYDEAARQLEACPDNPVTWSARLRLARAADRPEQAARALDHLSKSALTPRAVMALRAWLAARRGDREAERTLLERLVDLDPGDTTALDRLVALAQESGDAPRTAELRRRQSEASHRKERYRWAVIKLAAPQRDALVDLAGQAEALGRDFEAEGWWTLAITAAPGDGTLRDALERFTRRTRGHAPPTEARFEDLLADAARLATGATPPAAPAWPVHFDDHAAVVGLTARYEAPPTPLCPIPEVMGGGLALLDYDGDGWLDVFVIQAGPFPPPANPGHSRDRLFRNRGDGTFEDVSDRAGITKLPGGYGNGVTAADYDNDGRPDLFLTRFGSYALWHNTGHGFEDVTAHAGLGGDRGWPTSAAFADLDGDGDLDLYVCQYLDWDVSHPPRCMSALVPGRVISCLPLGFPAQPDRLYRNDHGHFVDVSAAAGITAGDPNGRSLGVVAADLDGDGRLDLYVTNDQSANLLFHNLGGLRFEEVGFASGAACAADGVFRAGMGIACGDADGDGRPDLVVGNFFGESLTFFRNLGSSLFVDQTNLSGLAAPSHFRLSFGAGFLDANNDGILDLATANGHVNDERPKAPFAMAPLFFLGGEHGRFTDLSAQAGPPWNRLLIGRGLAVGDLDNDGRVDVVIVPQNDPVLYAHNRTEGGHWVTFHLTGTTSNRDAIGARVTISAAGRRLTSWRNGGSSYASASDPRLHFGLANAERVDVVEVAWPSGRVDRFHDLPANTGYLLREGSTHAEPLPGFTPHRPEPSQRTRSRGESDKRTEGHRAATMLRFLPLNFSARCGEASWPVTCDYAASSGQTG